MVLTKRGWLYWTESNYETIPSPLRGRVRVGVKFSDCITPTLELSPAEVQALAYDTYEAARLISWSNKQAGIPPLTEAELTKWIHDHVALLNWFDIWEEDGKETKFIDFPTLISLRMICLLNSYGVSLEELKEFALLSRDELGLEWPFASRSLWNLSSSAPKNALSLDSVVTNRIVTAMILHFTGSSLSLGDLEFDQDGIAYAWLPVKDVVIDARVVSGSPCVAGTRTPTWVFTGMLKGGDNIEELADGYRLSKEQVRNALDWERQLDAACA